MSWTKQEENKNEWVMGVQFFLQTHLIFQRNIHKIYMELGCWNNYDAMQCYEEDEMTALQFIHSAVVAI